MSLNVDILDGNRTFTPGDTVQGIVKVNAEHPVKAKSLRVFLKASAQTEWLVSVYGIDSVHGRSAKVLYTASVIYGHEEHSLWAPEEHEKKGTIPQGMHAYPFEFVLPTDCPPSFEGTCGSISCTITAEIERPWKTNKTSSVTLSVCPVFDLNLIAEAALAASALKFKKTGCMLFRHGKICIQMKLQRSGFVVGETLEAVAEINNNSKQPVVKLDLRLRRVDSYTAYRHRRASNNDMKRSNKRQEETTVAENTEHINIAPNEVETATVSLEIPETIPTFRTCSIIEVTYYVEVRAVCKGAINNSVACRHPVVIGTLPLTAKTADDEVRNQ
ncbi:hypothetical protein NECAME_15420 [Necator americanus]|uniref:Arrestin C-terminal-like domain-containing protein n=1 Tax=Necator americanus TaxID=51031 RepID=W2SKM2_NECAM|nr:hypothetical protein NECAME_15420 [Necator americanus]ETN69257.1 hypothetical protein NECAME_15420 [Necator americanus]